VLGWGPPAARTATKSRLTFRELHGPFGRGGTSDTVKHPRGGVTPVFSATQEEIIRELHGPFDSISPGAGASRPGLYYVWA
jgi:hypothetical protein